MVRNRGAVYWERECNKHFGRLNHADRAYCRKVKIVDAVRKYTHNNENMVNWVRIELEQLHSDIVVADRNRKRYGEG